jgi:hypothetical protein
MMGQFPRSDFQRVSINVANSIRDREHRLEARFVGAFPILPPSRFFEMRGTSPNMSGADRLALGDASVGLVSQTCHS